MHLGPHFYYYQFLSWISWNKKQTNWYCSIMYNRHNNSIKHSVLYYLAKLFCLYQWKGYVEVTWKCTLGIHIIENTMTNLAIIVQSIQATAVSTVTEDCPFISFTFNLKIFCYIARSCAKHTTSHHDRIAYIRQKCDDDGQQSTYRNGTSGVL